MIVRWRYHARQVFCVDDILSHISVVTGGRDVD